MISSATPLIILLLQRTSFEAYLKTVANNKLKRGLQRLALEVETTCKQK